MKTNKIKTSGSIDLYKSLAIDGATACYTVRMNARALKLVELWRTVASVSGLTMTRVLIAGKRFDLHKTAVHDGRNMYARLTGVDDALTLLVLLSDLERTALQTARFKVIFGAEYMRKNRARQLEAILEAFPGFSAQEVQISRLDLALDFVPTKKINVGKLIKMWQSGRVRTHYRNSRIIDGAEPSLTIGMRTSPLQVCFYDKMAQVCKTDYSLALQFEEEFKSGEVHRAELRLFRDSLRAYGCQTLSDLRKLGIERMFKILYKVLKFLKRKPSTNPERDVIDEGFSALFSPVSEPERQKQQCKPLNVSQQIKRVATSLHRLLLSSAPSLSFAVLERQVLNLCKSSETTKGYNLALVLSSSAP